MINLPPRLRTVIRHLKSQYPKANLRLLVWEMSDDELLRDPLLGRADLPKLRLWAGGDAVPEPPPRWKVPRWEPVVRNLQKRYPGADVRWLIAALSDIELLRDPHLGRKDLPALRAWAQEENKP